ncbi:MAG: trimethylamine methyltransferase family protein [Deltaproteobacteria bacterium]|jgi:trimethylamine--corrinoid protein Co-methyltransferase|nr:trimethylamine methyltransferase family protein [Deltaproteobacteria bacterium]MBW2530644.1 trimethylamine methyltransferase family protein [Deltaproteobacteria bacterium]
MTALRPTLRLLADDDVQRIVDQACRVLETAGALVENDEARKLLRDAGANEKDGRVQLGEALVRAAVESAPSRIAVYDRAGNLAMDLGDDRVHFDPGSAAIHIFDVDDNRRREVTTADAVAFARLVDGLPHYAAQATSLAPADVPKEIADRYRLFLVLRNSTKPVITGTFAKSGFAPMQEMLSAVRGGAEALREKPLAIFDCCPSPPLKWSDLTCQALIDCARAGIPAELVSMPLTGATSPVTLREAVVQHCAENLSGVTIHQLAQQGAPIIYGGSPAAFDMRRGTTPMGAVETMMIDAAYAQVGKHLGLPTHAYMGLSDAKCPDHQAGYESGIGAVLAALAGVNVVSGPGMLDFEMCQSLEKVLLDHDAVGLAHRLVRGIEQREGDAVDLIGELVGLSSFLGHPHTRENWRKDLTVASTLVDRDTYGDWEAKGSKWAHQRAQEEVQRRLERAEILPLSDDVDAALWDIMFAEAKRHGVDALPES